MQTLCKTGFQSVGQEEYFLIHDFSFPGMFRIAQATVGAASSLQELKVSYDIIRTIPVIAVTISCIIYLQTNTLAIIALTTQSTQLHQAPITIKHLQTPKRPLEMTQARPLSGDTET